MSLLCNELNPDILVVSEHGFRPNTVEYFKINQLQLAQTFCRQYSKGGGIAIFVKNTMNFENFAVKDSSEFDFEAKGIKNKHRF